MPVRGAPSSAAEDGSLRPYRAGLYFGFFNALTWQVALGTPMVLFAERLGASSTAIGLAYSFVFLLTPIQIIATSFLPRFGYKRMMLTGWGVRSLFLLVPVGLAWMAPEEGGGGLVVAFIGALFFFTLFRSIGACALLPWLNVLLPDRVRGKYFSTDQAVAGIAGVGTLLLCSLFFQVLPLYDAFLWQYGVAFIGSGLAFWSLSRLPDGERPRAMSLRRVLTQTPRLMLAKGPYRDFLLISIWAGAAVSAIPPFCAYYLRVGPNLTAAQIVLFTTIQYGGVITGSLLIRNRVDRAGPRPFFFGAMILYALLATGWVALLHGGYSSVMLLRVMYFFLGVAASCWASANMKYLPQVVNPGVRDLAFSVHGAATSVVSGISPIALGWFIKGSSVAPSVNEAAFELFFVFVLISAGGIMLLVRRLPAPAGAVFEWNAGGLALRPFRALTYLATLIPVGSATESGRRPGRREPLD